LQINTGLNYVTGDADRKRPCKLCTPISAGWPTIEHQIREVMATDYFLVALEDPKLGLKIRERNSENLSAALRIALQLKV